MIEQSISDSMIEAPRIEGCSEFGIFNRIVLPCIMPGVATMCIFNFVASWNAYMGPLIIMQRKELYTMPVMISMIKGLYVTNYGAMYLAVAISVIPIMIVFAIFSRYIIERPDYRFGKNRRQEMSNVTWYSSNEQAQWKQKQHERASSPATLEADGRSYQKMLGFGGCFNELGYRALSHLSPTDRAALLTELYAQDGANFNVCRVPIGANDYAEDWYSLDETPGDYALKHFSIERDKHCLIPYIKEAQAYQPEMVLFASPWSPPTWMKNPAVYNWGKLIQTPENLRAYAHYFARFVQAYAEQGVKIDQVSRAKRAGRKPEVPIVHVDGRGVADVHSGLHRPCAAGAVPANRALAWHDQRAGL